MLTKYYFSLFKKVVLRIAYSNQKLSNRVVAGIGLKGFKRFCERAMNWY
jgi:hypothetical protein